MLNEEGIQRVPSGCLQSDTTAMPMNVKGNVTDNWKYFKKSWKNYILATGLDKKDKTVVMATLYTVLGKEANQIAENLEVTDPADSNSLIEALSSYFEPQKNTIFERYLFNNRMKLSISI